MINKTLLQKGSAHIVIIVILVLALLGALGFIFWRNFINKDASVKKTETTQEQSKDEYAGWETYKSVRDGYSIKYPADWFLVSETASDGPYIRNFDPNAQPANPPKDYITLRILKTEANDGIFAGSTATEWYNKLGNTEVSYGPVTYTPSNPTDYEVNGMSAKKTESVFDETNEDIFLLKNGSLYNISLHPSGMSDDATVKKILNSFMFLQ